MRKEYVSMKIANLLKERNWSLYRLAKESGVQTTNLEKICFCNRIPTIPTIMKICNGFGITLSEFFDEGDIAIKQLTFSEQQMLEYFHSMAGEDKKLVSDYIHKLSKHAPAAADHAKIAENTVNPAFGCRGSFYKQK